MRSRLVCLLSTNGVNTNPPPVRAREDSSSTSNLSNTLVPRGGGGGRGGGRVTRRGLPGRGGGSGRGGANTSEREEKPVKKGKIPSDYRKIKDTNGKEICVKFNKEGGCPEVIYKYFWKLKLYQLVFRVMVEPVARSQELGNMFAQRWLKQTL